MNKHRFFILIWLPVLIVRVVMDKSVFIARHLVIRYINALNSIQNQLQRGRTSSQRKDYVPIVLISTWFLNAREIGVGLVQEHMILFNMERRLHIFHKNKGSMKKDLISISFILKCKDLLTLKLKDHIPRGLFSLNILLLHKNLLKFKH
ncbi:hypothetical protein JTB14_014969 [Gonioctena quinquepunctata]|nr:hypothetical protein JTB14_014969 [Gonioctena quinquepunctata]